MKTGLSENRWQRATLIEVPEVEAEAVVAEVAATFLREGILMVVVDTADDHKLRNLAMQIRKGRRIAFSHANSQNRCFAALLLLI